MKCGSCRITSADAYSRIKDDDLLGILKTLNPNRRYNPKYLYFCEACIQRAKVQQILKDTAISDQNAASFSVVNTTNVSNDSGSPNDEFDKIVSANIVFSEKGTPLHDPRKRPINSSNTAIPCPKRFKKPLVPLAPVTADHAVEGAKSVRDQRRDIEGEKLPERQQSSSEAIVEAGFMIDSSSESSQSLPKEASGILSSQGSPDKRTTTPTTTTKSSKRPLVPVQLAAIVESSATVTRKKPCPKRFKPTLEVSGTARVITQTHQQSSSESSSEIRTNAENSSNNSVSSKGSPDENTSIPNVSSNDSVVSNASESHQSEHSDRDVSMSSNRHTKDPQKRTSPGRPGRTVVNKAKAPVLNDDSDSDDSIPPPQKKIVSGTSSVRSVNPPLDVLPGPSAPAPKNPRIRQPAVQTIRSTRDYFSVVNEAIDVNNFSRSLAG